MVELISVHTPKCAGISFKKTLEQAYPNGSIHWVYDDRVDDPSAPINLDPEGFYRIAATRTDPFPGKRVIHGHFNINKFSHIKDDCARITFLRHPVARLISHYYFWMTHPRHGHALHDYMLDNLISLAQFCRLPYMRFFYTQVMFRDVDMNVFDFIGIVERGDEEIDRLGKLLGRPLHPQKLNENKLENYNDLRSAIFSDPALMSFLNESLTDDIRFFERFAGYTKSR